MKAVLITSLFALIFWNCNSKEENLLKVDLTNLGIRIKLPKNNSILFDNLKASINLNPNGRTVRLFSITKLKMNLKKTEYIQSITFDNSGHFEYYTFSEGGGSGGIEYELEGILKFKDELFLIKASDQKSGEKGDPKFCFKYLTSIEELIDS